MGGAFLLSDSFPKSTLNPIATSSVVIALVSFACTVVIHSTKRIIVTEKVLAYLKRKKEDEVIKKEANQPLSVAQKRRAEPTVQVIELEEEEYDPSIIREELLETAY